MWKLKNNDEYRILASSRKEAVMKFKIDLDIDVKPDMIEFCGKNKLINKEQFIDEFLDTLYMYGNKEDGKYILRLNEATGAAEQIFNTFFNK